MGRSDLPWLVKSSGRILGPFAADRIAELLATREISVLDEISQPLRRWQTIQYHEEFRDVVDHLRKANLSERTEVTWTPHSNTSSTQTLTDVLDGDLTEELSGDQDGFTNTAKEIVIHNVREQNQIAPSGAGRFQAPGLQNPALQRKVESTARGLWIATGLILLIASGFILNKCMSGTAGRNLSAGSIRQTVINLIQVGQYKEALRELKIAYPEPSQSGDMAIYYGSLLIQVEGQTIIGRRLLSQVIQSKRPEAKQAYAGLGIADLIDGQLDAGYANFERSLQIDPDYVPALVNMSSVSLQKGDFIQAKALAQRAMRLSPYSGEAVLNLVEAQLFLSKENTQDLTNLSGLVQNFLRRNWDFNAELGFYALYLNFLRRERGIEAKIQEYLDRDPNLTREHRHNMLIYRGRNPLKYMSQFCEQMTAQMGADPRVAAVLATCQARDFKWDGARRSIEKAVNMAPKDPLIQAWYSLILRESGDRDQASVVLARATELNRRNEYALPTLMQARFCQEKNLVDCAGQNWKTIHERESENVAALAGLAWVQAQKKFFGEAIKTVDRGLKVSPDYIPLLQLRQRAEAEGWSDKGSS